MTSSKTRHTGKAFGVLAFPLTLSACASTDQPDARALVGAPALPDAKKSAQEGTDLTDFLYQAE